MIHRGQRPLAAELLTVAIFAGLLVAGLRAGIKRPAVWLLSAGVLTAGAPYYGGLHSGGPLPLEWVEPGRYSFAPQALFSLSVVALAATSDKKISTLAWAASVWLLVIGAPEFFFPQNPRWVADGPAWRPEVAAWQADPNYKLQIWPSWPRGFEMMLQRLPASR